MSVFGLSSLRHLGAQMTRRTAHFPSSSGLPHMVRTNAGCMNISSTSSSSFLSAGSLNGSMISRSLVTVARTGVAPRSVANNGLYSFGTPILSNNNSNSGCANNVSVVSPVMQMIRHMNRNARRPSKANHGKRPCSHARRRAKRGLIKSRAYRTLIFGSY